MDDNGVSVPPLRMPVPSRAASTLGEDMGGVVLAEEDSETWLFPPVTMWMRSLTVSPDMNTAESTLTLSSSRSRSAMVN